MPSYLVAALIGALTLAIVPAAPPSQAKTPAPLRYVHMGDSFSAASGVLPPDPSAPPQCLRSAANFGRVIARTTGASLTDVSCGAAQTRDFFRPQYYGVAPQLEALQRNTQLVTMTIGGNDNNTFVDAIISCGAAGLSTAGRGSPCQDRYGGSFARDIRRTTYPALVRTLRAVGQRSPRAEVAILGYPWILPEKVGCFERMPVARGDVRYLRGIQALLNRVVKRAAAATGSTYVNLNRASDGHDACQPVGTRWVEPVLTTTNPVVVHPNALGEAEMAAKAVRVLDLG